MHWAACPSGRDCCVCGRRLLLSEMSGEVDGLVLGVRDALATGEGFTDSECPLRLFNCGWDAAGNPVTVHCVAVGKVSTQVLLDFPATFGTAR